MLTEDNEIDQLFKSKLGNLEKIPPAALWGNIEGELNLLRKGRRIAMLKNIGIAASILLAVASGWWITYPGGRSVVSPVIISDQVTNKSVKESELVQLAADQSGKLKEKVTSAKNSPKEGNALPTKTASFAAFAADISFMTKGAHSVNSIDSALGKSDHAINQKIELVEKIAHWIASSVSNDSGKVQKSDSYPSGNAFKEASSQVSGVNSFTNRGTITNGRWSLKAEYSPVLNSHSRGYGKLAGPQSSIAHYYSSHKTAVENSFSAGVIAGYKIGKRVTVKSGIMYNEINQSTPGVKISMMNPNGEYVDSPEFSENNSLKQNFQFVEIPLRVGYKLNNRRFGVGITGGLSTGFLVGNRVTLRRNGDPTSNGKLSNLRNVVYSGMVGLEFGYEISNRLLFSVEPRLKHSINSLSTNNSVDYKTNQLEIATGLTYSFN